MSRLHPSAGRSCILIVEARVLRLQLVEIGRHRDAIGSRKRVEMERIRGLR